MDRNDAAQPHPEHDGADELDAALERVDNLDGAPLHTHADAFENLHRVLQQRLSEADGADGPVR